MNKTQGLVNRIIPFSSVDGPGNRLVIFLQGCNMNCINCHNPHTIGVCNFCGLCTLKCPTKAIEIYSGEPPWINFDQSLCLNCDLCLQVCPVYSNPRSRWMEIDEAVKIIQQKADFLSGITVSGGEATLQIEFVRELFVAIKDDAQLSRLTTFIDTNGTAPIYKCESLLPVLDGAMVDLKALDVGAHQSLTGRVNELILETISFLHQEGKLYEVRLLIIPDYNSSEEQIEQTVEYLSQICPQTRIRLIPYRQHGVRSEADHLQQPDEELMERIKVRFFNGGFGDTVIT